MLDVIVEHQAGIPVLMKPLSGNRSDAQDFGQIVSTHISQLQTTYGMTCLVADSALYSAENLQKLAETHMKWITRVPATVSEAQAALAQANPQTMAPLMEGYRYQELTSTYGKVEQRWVLIYSEPRQAQAQRTVDKQLLKQSDKDLKAFKKLCGTPFACEADARQALATWERGDDPRLRTQILRVRQQGRQRLAHRLKQQRTHHTDIGQPEGVELMGQREDDMVMVTGEQPRLLECEPALGLEVRALGAGAMPTRVVPDPQHMAVGARLDMAAERGGATLHNGPCGAPDMGRQRMALLVGRIRVLKDGLERHESHQGLPQRIG